MIGMLVSQVALGGPLSLAPDRDLVPPVGCEAAPLPARGGDLDGDGLAELVVTAYGGGCDDEPAHLWYGDTAGWDAAPDLSIHGSRSALLFAEANAEGDFDGDGFGDLALGAPSSFGSSELAVVEVRPGSASGPTGPVVVLEHPSGNFGWRMAVGDFDGDGFDDLVVGDYAYDAYRGSVEVFPGSASGVATVPTGTWSGQAERDVFGIKIGAGDIDGDGFDDLLVGARDEQEGNGAVYWYRGSAAGLSAVHDQVIRGQGGVAFGSALDLGDVNGDGFADAVVGAQHADDSAGRAFVFLGSADGLSSAPDQNLPPLPSSVHFGDMLVVDDFDRDGYADAVIGVLNQLAIYAGSSTGLSAPEVVASPEPSFGRMARPAGDVNGDGAGDLSVMSQSKLFVFFGIPSEPADADADGVDRFTDCDDEDASVFPGAPEVVADGIDQDCDAGDTCQADADGDGARAASSTAASADLDCADEGEATAAAPEDCDDADPGRAPGLSDVPGDGIDQDCDGEDAAEPETPPADGEPSTDGCGCDHRSGAGLLPVLLGAIAGVRRRRSIGRPG